MEVRQKEVVELQTQVKALGQEVKDTDEVDSRRQLVEMKFQELLEPLRCRKNFLVESREIHQFNRDVEDEIVRDPETLRTLSFSVGTCLGMRYVMCCLPAVGSGEDGCGHVLGPWTQPADGPAAHQEEPGETTNQIPEAFCS